MPAFEDPTGSLPAVTIIALSVTLTFAPDATSLRTGPSTVLGEYPVKEENPVEGFVTAQTASPTVSAALLISPCSAAFGATGCSTAGFAPSVKIPITDFGLIPVALATSPPLFCTGFVLAELSCAFAVFFEGAVSITLSAVSVFFSTSGLAPPDTEG
jgi:hypothetical protein